MTAGFAFLVLAKNELTALRRDGRGLRLRLVKKRRSSKEAAAEGESKEPKVPWRERAEPAVALLVGRRWACGWVVPTKRSGVRAEKCAIAFVRSPSPPESRKRQGRNTPIFQPCRAEPVGRAANFRANFHGAAAKLNAPQAFNAPTCHGNSRNGGLRPRATADAQGATRSAPLW